MLDKRAQTLLKTLIERYIAEGQPVGSRTLSRFSGLELSPATIRNVMSDLEEMGFISSPHTSAGRIPTPRGYRLFVDTLLTVRPLAVEEVSEIQGAIQPDQPQRVLTHASHLLSELTHFAGVVIAPRRQAPRIRQIEFISLSEKRILLIIVTDAGDVQNRILFTQRTYSPAELVAAGNYLNEHFAGHDFPQIRGRLQDEEHKEEPEQRYGTDPPDLSRSTTYLPSSLVWLVDISMNFTLCVQPCGSSSWRELMISARRESFS